MMPQGGDQQALDCARPTAECCAGTYREVVSGTGGGGGSGGRTASEKAVSRSLAMLAARSSEGATGGQQSFCNAGHCCFTDEGGESCRVVAPLRLWLE